MTVAFPAPTKTERAAHKSRRNFHEKIAAQAAALASSASAMSLASLKAAELEPEYDPAERDPPAERTFCPHCAGQLSGSPVGTLTMLEIKHVAAIEFCVTIEDMVSHRRHAGMVLARQAAMYLIKELLRLKTLPEIARAFGNRDHTTVIHACRAIPIKMARNPDLAARIEIIRAKVLAR